MEHIGWINLFSGSLLSFICIYALVNKYFINGKTLLLFEENLKCENFALEVNFKSISNDIIYDLNKILENYQI